MENPIFATEGGIVKEIKVKVNQQVAEGDVLIVLEQYIKPRPNHNELLTPGQTSGLLQTARLYSLRQQTKFKLANLK